MAREEGDHYQPPLQPQEEWNKVQDQKKRDLLIAAGLAGGVALIGGVGVGVWLLTPDRKQNVSHQPTPTPDWREPTDTQAILLKPPVEGTPENSHMATITIPAHAITLTSYRTAQDQIIVDAHCNDRSQPFSYNLYFDQANGAYRTEIIFVNTFTIPSQITPSVSWADIVLGNLDRVRQQLGARQKEQQVGLSVVAEQADGNTALLRSQIYSGFDQITPASLGVYNTTG